MHFVLVVVIPSNEVDPETYVENLMAPYDQKKEVAEYKDYHDSKEIKFWMRSHGVSQKEALIENIEDLYSDEKGLYSLSTFNQNGQWDYWVVEDKIHCTTKMDIRFDNPKWYECSAQLADLKEISFSAILTPDGVWHDIEDFGWRLIDDNPEKNKEALLEWDLHRIRIIDTYADHVGLLPNVHC